MEVVICGIRYKIFFTLKKGGVGESGYGIRFFYVKKGGGGESGWGRKFFLTQKRVWV